MRAWKLLKTRRARALAPALAATLLFTALVGASTFHRAIAQDVIVFPPAPATDAPAASDSAPTTTAPNFVRQEATGDNAATTPSTPPAAAETAPPATSAAAAALDLSYRQCSADADCVFANDGCGALDTVNKDSLANWLASMPHGKNCRGGFDPAKVAQDFQAVCADGICNTQKKVKP